MSDRNRFEPPRAPLRESRTVRTPPSPNQRKLMSMGWLAIGLTTAGYLFHSIFAVEIRITSPIRFGFFASAETVYSGACFYLARQLWANAGPYSRRWKAFGALSMATLLLTLGVNLLRLFTFGFYMEVVFLMVISIMGLYLGACAMKLPFAEDPEFEEPAAPVKR